MAREYVWTTTGSDRVCDSCALLAEETATLEVWDNSGGRPGIRGTLCNGNCECILIPTDSDDTRLQKELDRLAEEGFQELTDKMKAGIKLDLRRGGKVVVLKDYRDIKGVTTVPLQLLDDLDILTARWKMVNGTLPVEFFKLADIDKMIAWLEVRT